MESKNKITTKVVTLEEIVSSNSRFTVPSYQRPYVWTEDDVLKLLNDIQLAFMAKEDEYFIGTTLSCQLAEGHYELIDGQQRTTTLMLIAIAFRSTLEDSLLHRFPTYQQQPRLQYAVRDDVQRLLGAWSGLSGYDIPSPEQIANSPYLTQLAVALQTLKGKVGMLAGELAEKELTLAEFAGFLFTKVKWVNNTVPAGQNLNGLFAAMNTTGVQLDQCDLLKAKLLAHIKSDKQQYNAIWMVCEHMENFFERNVRKVFQGTDWKALSADLLANYDPLKFKLKESEVNRDALNNHEMKDLTIAAIAAFRDPITGCSNTENIAMDASEIYDLNEYCRPIIQFPLLLIHAYRVYLVSEKQSDIGPRLHSDKLLEIFSPLLQKKESEIECKIKKFFEILWQVRYQFDSWVIKWIKEDQTNEAHLALTEQRITQAHNSSYINRTIVNTGPLVLLQSVRYFTGERSAQYWLTPLICRLLDSKSKTVEDVAKLLELIDNQLSLAEGTQKAASFKLAVSHSVEARSWQKEEEELNKRKGTGFEHYWFQKLEYLLWKDLKQNEKLLSDEDQKKFARFRITAKNSVEHVFPQSEEHGKRIEKLDDFGNVVLLSPGENSSFSNQAVDKKRVDFLAKPDWLSLKLRDIFLNETWDDEAVVKHQQRMITLLRSHYTTCPDSVFSCR